MNSLVGPCDSASGLAKLMGAVERATSRDESEENTSNVKTRPMLRANGEIGTQYSDIFFI